MYIRLAQGNVDPSKLDDYVAFIRSALPVEKEQLGYRNAYHAIDREKSRSMIVSIWDTEPPPPVLNNELVARLQALGLQPEGIVTFEVVDEV